eukprot:scaffold11747_cov90-Isochrysis_galbana.AAC.1
MPTCNAYEVIVCEQFDAVEVQLPQARHGLDRGGDVRALQQAASPQLQRLEHWCGACGGCEEAWAVEKHQAAQGESGQLGQSPERKQGVRPQMGHVLDPETLQIGAVVRNRPYGGVSQLGVAGEGEGAEGGGAGGGDGGDAGVGQTIGASEGERVECRHAGDEQGGGR